MASRFIYSIDVCTLSEIVTVCSNELKQITYLLA